MSALSFIAEHGGVSMLTGRGTVRLQPAQVDRLLEIFDHDESRDLFLDLWDAKWGRTSAIPTPGPVTLAVRQLDPEIWAEALAVAKAA
jgi:hypothetical protein